MYSTSEVGFFNFHSKHHYTRPMAADWEPGLKVLRVGEWGEFIAVTREDFRKLNLSIIFGTKTIIVLITKDAK